MRVYTRYDLPDEKDDTRRKRNERVGIPSPDLNIPPEGLYLWEWYRDIHDSVYRGCDGYYHLIPPTEFLAWSELTGNLINSVEYDILKAMDGVFCLEMNKDIRAKQEKESEALKKGKR